MQPQPAAARGYVKQGIRAAGGTPIEFNTIAVSDGVSMGTTGMRASLVSREVIADSIELVARGHLFDGLVCIVGCDKTIPAAVMALARLDLPGLVLYGGSIAPGRYRGKDVTIQDVFEVVGAHAAGTMSDDRGARARERRVPGRRRVRRPLHREHDGDGARLPRRQRTRAERDPGQRIPGKPQAAVRAGELAMKLVEADTRPSQVLTRDAFENAIAAIAGDRRLDERRPAPARDRRTRRASSSRSTTSTRSRRGRRSSPTSSRAAATSRPTSSEAGGVALVARELVRGGRRRTRTLRGVDGRTLREVADGAFERPGQEVVVAWDDPLKPTGGLAILRGNLAPDGCVVKLAGHERLHHRGPARVFDSEEDCFAAVKARAIAAGRRRRHPLRGPRGRPGDARDAARHRVRSSARGSATRSR